MIAKKKSRILDSIGTAAEEGNTQLIGCKVRRHLEAIGKTLHALAS